MSARVTFSTSDGVTIVGDLYEGPVGGPSALLLHMMPATKESWGSTALALIAAGFSSVLAIDLRGHGESVESAPVRLDYKAFTDAEHQAKIRDVEASAAWLEKERGADQRRLVLIGASIGANLAISFAAAHPDIPAVVALSPGLDYHGVTAVDKVAAFAADQALLLVASADDEYSLTTIRTLSELDPEAEMIELVGAGHGTLMLERQPDLVDQVVRWLIVHTKE